MTMNTKSVGNQVEREEQDGSFEQKAQSPLTNKEQEKQTVQPRVSSKSRKSSSAFKTISEVAKELDVQQHVLRFWETKFSQIRPLKRGGGRRYYRPEDVELLHTIQNLLYTEGYTIKGVQKLLREQGKNKVVQEYAKGSSVDEKQAAMPQARPQAAVEQKPAVQTGQMNEQQRQVLKSVLTELKELRAMIKTG